MRNIFLGKVYKMSLKGLQDSQHISWEVRSVVQLYVLNKVNTVCTLSAGRFHRFTALQRSHVDKSVQTAIG